MPLNPQQQKFKDCYINPSSSTFGNAYKSAIKAGFKPNYAKVITSQGYEWYTEILRDKEMLESAEKALKETIEFNPVDEKGKIDSGVARVRLDASKLALQALNPKWNPKTDIDIKTDGKPLGESIVEAIAKIYGSK